MKRFLVFCGVLGVGVALGRMLDGVAAKAEGGGAGLMASRNGDADGRDGITINDPIYLLNWLFLGGPEPVPCPVSEVSSGLPDTGQTKCYDGSGEELTCSRITPAPCLGGQDGTRIEKSINFRMEVGITSPFICVLQRPLDRGASPSSSPSSL